MELYEHLVEPDLVNPTFVCDFPEVAQPLPAGIAASRV